jgi:hypothetical protein
LIRRQFIRGQAKYQGEQQRSCQCDERDSHPDLVIKAAPTHLGTRLYELTGEVTMAMAYGIFLERQRQPFTGRFTQQKSLAHLRAEYEGLARG